MRTLTLNEMELVSGGTGKAGPKIKSRNKSSSKSKSYSNSASSGMTKHPKEPPMAL